MIPVPASFSGFFRLLGLLAFGVAAQSLSAATYYVSPSGDDLKTGATPADAWQTLARVNAANFVSGDQILFESGKTFVAPANSDALVVKGAGASDAARIVYGIYGGSARAVISQPTAGRNGVKFAAANDWVTLRDLEIVGPHVWTASTAGATTPYGIHLQGSSGNVLQGTTIERVVIHNFKGSGIRSNSGEKLSDTRIVYTEVYQVGDAGIRLGSDTDTQDGEFRQNLYIGHCYVHHTSGFPAGSGNHNGDGIQIACGKNVVVEYCVVHDIATAFSGNAGGPVGIWFADVHDGLIQFCEAYNCTNGVSSSDGGGIDIDGGCTDTVAQYNYTHDNEGAGFLLAHWGSATGAYCSPTDRNTFRYNISINDTKSSVQGGLAVWSAGGAGTCLDTRFHNNLVVQTRPSRGDPCLNILTTSAGNATNPIQVYNNIFVTANGHKLTNTASRPNAVILNNLWWALDGNFNYNGGTLATTDAAGIQIDPLLANPDALYAPPIVGFARIDQMTRVLADQFKLLAGSPALNAGRSQDLLGATIDTGLRDFFDNAIPQDGAYDLGAHESAPAAAGRFAVSSTPLRGAEGASLVVTVRRVGGSAGAASVDVATLNGLALAGADFTAVDQTLSWAAGDAAEQTVAIPLTDDAGVEGDEVFSVLLSNAAGAEIAGVGYVVATIADNDADAPASYTNPLALAGTDPFVTAGGDGKFYLYLTDGDGTTAPSRVESTDLVTWTNKQTAYSDITAKSPHVIFDPLGSEWWYFGASETARGTAPAGPFSKISDNWGTAPWHLIDPVDGQAYLYNGGGAAQNRHKIERLLNPTYSSETIYPYFIDAWWGSGWEGATIVKNGATYYWFLSMGSATTAAYRLAYATAPSPVGPWTIQTQESDAAILRQSNLEGIYGPGNPTVHTDTKGTSWLYYQQKETSGTAADPRIALDPLWFDTTGVPHVRPTRGAARPGPNSLPSALWPTVAATSTIQAESYAGSTLGTLSAGGSGTVVGTLRGQAYLAYRNVDFGTGLAGIQVNLSCGLADAGVVTSIEVRTGGVKGPLAGVLPVAKTGSFTTFQTLSGGLTQTLTGVQDVFLVFHGIRPGIELVRLDWITFTATGVANANLPPVAAPDSVVGALNSPVVIDVLANDSDPESAALTRLEAGNSTTLLRSFKAAANNLQLNVDGTITYTPPSATFWGDDVFFYTVRDASGGLATGTVKVRVALPGKLHRDYAGLAVIEAEDYNALGLNSDANGNWFAATATAGYAGAGYVTTTPGAASTINGAAYLDYAVDLHTPGVYTAWARCAQADTNSNSSQFSLTTAPTVSSPDRYAVTLDNVVQTGGWYWRKVASLASLRPGIHRLRINRQDAGHQIDRIVLSADANYDPAAENGGVGPLNASTLSLSAAAVSVAESAGSVSLTVSRAGLPAGAASVAYATADLTAAAGGDYSATSGTLSWADGDATSRTINIPLLDDTAPESDETFSLTLSNALGATLASPSAATITITDADESAPAGYASWTTSYSWADAPYAPAADADGDGLANLLEYALDSSPVSSTSGPGALPAVVVESDGDLTLTFTRLRPELTYTVQSATTLGAWNNVAVNPGAVGESVTVPHPDPAAPARFLRLQVSGPGE